MGRNRKWRARKLAKPPARKGNTKQEVTARRDDIGKMKQIGKHGKEDRGTREGETSGQEIGSVGSAGTTTGRRERSVERVRDSPKRDPNPQPNHRYKTV